MIKLSTKVYHYKNSIDGPGSVDLTPRSFRADGQYTAERYFLMLEKKKIEYIYMYEHIITFIHH